MSWIEVNNWYNMTCWFDQITWSNLADQQLIWSTDTKFLKRKTFFEWSDQLIQKIWNIVFSNRSNVNWSFRQILDWPEPKYCQLISQTKTWLPINTWFVTNTLFVTDSLLSFELSYMWCQSIVNWYFKYLIGLSQSIVSWSFRQRHVCW